MLFDRMPKSNLHTHTVFCDGADTPEEVVLAAIDAGMDTLGFSGHSCVSFDPKYSMSREKTLEYRQEVLRLREVYGDKINILLGLEQDFYADDPATGYDYLIGSVHYLPVNGTYIPIDHSRESFCRFVNEYYGGDIYRFTRHYYEHMIQVVEKTGCHIIGHFDLITKFNEGGVLFRENDPRYLKYALEALDALLEKDVVFEINTGAISRGYRRTPYPSPMFLRRIAELRGRVTLTSDAHSKKHLLYHFEDAVQFARAAGIGALTVMTRQGWRTISI